MADVVREIPGAVGPLECLIDRPKTAPRAAVVFAHPLPTEGGTMHTKVVYQSAKALAAIGCVVLRFNFRGVGRSAGAWDEGRGEMHDYTQGSLPRAVWLLAIPMVLEMAMESTFALVDVYFVSRLGDAAVAAVGVTESMLTIVYAFGIGLAMATTALVARRIGEKNVAGAVRGAAAAVALGVGLGVVLGAIALLFAPQLLRLMDAPAEVIATGNTPGLGVINVNRDGSGGELVAVLRISNVDATGVERADAHAVRVRTK